MVVQTVGTTQYRYVESLEHLSKLSILLAQLFGQSGPQASDFAIELHYGVDGSFRSGDLASPLPFRKDHGFHNRV